jgi:hypothetical protein
LGFFCIINIYHYIAIYQHKLKQQGTHAAVGLRDVGDEERGHDSIGGVLLEDLEGLKVGHAAVRPAELLVRDHGQGGSRGGDVGRDDGATLELDHRAPVLQALREGVVGALGDRQAVDDLDVVGSLDGRQGVLAQELPQG